MSTDPGDAFDRQLEPCKDCGRLPDSFMLHTWNYQKPCVQFHTHSEWRPNPCKVFYLAESPPGTSNGYFYNPPATPTYRATLRNALFQLLRISRGDPLAGLREFRDTGFFLSDAVKCRCDKGDRAQLPMSLVRNCGEQWLARELELVNPQKICTLGKAALRALSTVSGCEELESYNAGEHCGRIVNVARPVLIWVFPGTRTSNFSSGHEETFRKFAVDP